MIYSFADFELDADRAELRREGARVHLEPQAFDLLHALVARHDRVVGRDEIFQLIWGDRIVSDAALASRLRDVRRALGDEGREGRFIRTIKGRGVRFVAEVAGAEEAPSGGGDHARHAIPALGVLPFAGADDGIGEDIAAALVAWRVFPVMTVSAPDAADPSLRYLVGGTLRRSGDTATLRLSLTDAPSQSLIWSERLSLSADADGAWLEDAAARAAGLVVLQVERTEARRGMSKTPEEMTPWELAIRAAWLSNRMNPGDLDAGLALATQAAEAAPDWLHPFTLIADCRFQQAFQNLPIGAHEEAFAAALQAAKAALDIDPSSWSAHALTGLGELWSNGNHDRALLHVNEGVRLNPSALKAYHFAGCVAGFAGDLDHALAAQSRMIRIDPTFRHRPVVEADLALWHLLKGEFERARALLDRSVRWSTAHRRTYHRRIALFGLTGDAAAAREACTALAAFGPMGGVERILGTYPFREDAHREIFREGLIAG
ncbi:MAG: winged helix-turn-helix domain-containing protein, partial [Pseudomonadota bacterium]